MASCETPANSSPKRLLVVDDYPANTLAMRAALSPLGATVREANSGEEALALIASEHFDAILMDVRMPGWSGSETCAQLSQKAPHCQAPVLFHSAEDLMTHELDALRRYSALPVLRKPVEPSLLVARVRELLAS